MSGVLGRLAATFVAPSSARGPEAPGPVRADRPAMTPAQALVDAPTSRPPVEDELPGQAPAEDGRSGEPPAEDGWRARLPGGVTPSDRPVVDDGRVAPPAATVGVLARPADAWAAGGAVALRLLGQARAPVAVVCVWGAGAGPAALAPATPAARRLAGRLGERGHDARATGRLVLVALAGEVGPACAEATRVAVAAGEAPAVVVLAGARTGRVDALLGEQDRVIVAAAGPDDTIADLAVASLAVGAVPVRVAPLAGPAPARALAATGVALVAPLRAEVEAALR